MKGLPPRRADVARWRGKAAELKAAVKLLRAARNSINYELGAIGPDEVRTNPLLRAQANLVERIDSFLEGKGGGK